MVVMCDAVFPGRLRRFSYKCQDKSVMLLWCYLCEGLFKLILFQHLKNKTSKLASMSSITMFDV